MFTGRPRCPQPTGQVRVTATDVEGTVLARYCPDRMTGAARPRRVPVGNRQRPDPPVPRAGVAGTRCQLQSRDRIRLSVRPHHLTARHVDCGHRPAIAVSTATRHVDDVFLEDDCSVPVHRLRGPHITAGCRIEREDAAAVTTDEQPTVAFDVRDDSRVGVHRSRPTLAPVIHVHRVDHLPQAAGTPVLVRCN